MCWICCSYFREEIRAIGPCVRTFTPAADPSILVPKELGFPDTWGDSVWCLGRGSGGWAVPHKLQWRHSLKERSFLLSSCSCQHTRKPWMSSRMCWAGLRTLHGTGVFPAPAPAAGLGTGVSVCQSKTQHTADLCLLQKGPTQKA